MQTEMICKNIRNAFLRSRNTAESTRVPLVRPSAVFLALVPASLSEKKMERHLLFGKWTDVLACFIEL